MDIPWEERQESKPGFLEGPALPHCLWTLYALHSRSTMGRGPSVFLNSRRSGCSARRKGMRIFFPSPRYTHTTMLTLPAAHRTVVHFLTQLSLPTLLGREEKTGPLTGPFFSQMGRAGSHGDFGQDKTMHECCSCRVGSPGTERIRY